MPNTFIVNWNPAKWAWPEEDRRRKIRQTEIGQTAMESWSVGARKRGIEVGDQVYLLRQHTDRGILGSGTFTSTIYDHPHWDGSPRTTTFADIAWDTLLDAEDRLAVEDLKAEIPEITWDRLQGSGTQVPPGAVERLDSLWHKHLDQIEHRDPGEVDAPGAVHREGQVSTVIVNRYERDHTARRRCIEHWGPTCAVCGFDFGAVYGDIGEGYIHVHHLVEISTIGEEYEVDPINDLRPVCPNCHAMLHTRRPALAIDQLKRAIEA